MIDQRPSAPQVEAPNRSFWRNVSVVWLVPLLALVVALGIAWQAYSDRGTLVEIRFETGAGITAGETTIRYRDVVIGAVEDIHFSDDLNFVIASARIENDILPFLDDDAAFWVVEPEISAQGVSGLSTVVSGVYIEGAWDNIAGEQLWSFNGLEDPLFVRPGEIGRRIVLNVDPSLQLSGGTPLIFRGLPVGRLEEPRLVDASGSVRVEAFIEAPFDERISDATRFWDSSGFSIDFGADGLSLDVESIASLVGGGIEFDEVFTNGADVPEGYRFTIYTSEEVARASAFIAPIVGEVPVSVQFTEFTRGLRRGLGVFMDGVRVGQVSSVTVHSFETPEGPERRHVANLLLDPEMLGLPVSAGPEEVYAFLDAAVIDGLRARLSAEGLITSEFRIQLEDMNNPDPAAFDRDAVPFPRIPALATPRTSVNTTAEGVLERVAALPFEALLSQAIETLASIETLAGDGGFQQITEEALTLLTEARGLVGGEDAQAIPAIALEAVAELRDIMTALNDAESVAALTSALASADSAFGTIDTAIVRLPELMENLATLSGTAAGLDIGSVMTTANSVLTTADTLLSNEDLANVPSELSAALTDLSGLLTGLQEGGSVAALTSALASADSAFGTLDTATARLPELMNNLASLSATAEALELEALVTSATTVLASAGTFLSNEDLADVPSDLSGALTELETLLAALTAADVVGSLNSTLTAAGTAAASAETAANALPALVTQTEAVLAQIGSLSAAYGSRSELMVEAMDVLREITSAARSIAQLARTIERNPSSLITGR